MDTSLENLYVDIGAKRINRNLSNMHLQIGFCCSLVNDFWLIARGTPGLKGTLTC